ncbi:MAG: acyltransferase [Acidobacteria bacterium]|nr:acyltransferase [Acidobacteriota bacterium]
MKFSAMVKRFSGASKNTTRGHASDEIPNLDLLRAVAVLLVLLSHLVSYFDYGEIGRWKLNGVGAVGVYFFFVHTCFVLMLSLERQWKGQGALQLFGAFMIRRIFRIYPLSIAAVLFVVAFRLPQAQLSIRHFSALSPNLPTITSNLLLVQGAGRSVLGVMWSLPYEMAMYWFLPWLFLWLYLDKSLWRISLVWLLSVLAALVFLVHWGWPTQDYFVPYIPCFLSGVVGYQLWRIHPGRVPGIIWPAVVIGVIPLFIYQQSLLADYRLKAWLVCLLLGLAIPCFAQLTHPWLRKPAHLIAKYSYGVYLTHCFCMWICLERWHGVVPRIVRLGLFPVLLAGLPLIFYHLLEEPLILVGRRVSSRFEEVTAHNRICRTVLIGHLPANLAAQSK